MKLTPSIRKSREVNLSLLARFLRRRMGSRRALGAALQLVCEHWDRPGRVGNEREPDVLRKLAELSKKSHEAIEAELLIQNAPPQVADKISTDRGVWLSVVFVLFQMKLPFSQDFRTRVVESCLLQPTHMIFALNHSDSVGFLSKEHPPSWALSLVEILISSAEDSRAIYALKIARYLPDWAALSSATFNAMLSGNPVKRTEAMWLANYRSTVKEALSFAEDNAIDLPEAVKNADITTISRFILTSKNPIGYGGVLYAIDGGSAPVSLEEMRRISNRIKNALKDSRELS